MKTVKYVAGEFDIELAGKECLAIITGEGEKATFGKGTNEEWTAETKNLTVFVDKDIIAVRRLNVPHADNATHGSDGVSTHAYYEEN